MDEGQIRQKLRQMGVTPKKEDAFGIEVTICQFIVVVLSIMSVGFLFVPIFLLKDAKIIALFFILSFVCMVGGIWFWVKKAEICEHPEDYQDQK